MGTSGAESLSVVANIFVGQTEAPLVVKPYVERMTTSELMAVMTGGMAYYCGVASWQHTFKSLATPTHLQTI